MNRCICTQHLVQNDCSKLLTGHTKLAKINKKSNYVQSTVRGWVKLQTVILS